MPARDHTTQETIRSILDYDPHTGDFTWRERTDVSPAWNATFAGKRAGRKTDNGYWKITVNHRTYYAHRLAWLYMTGKWPAQDIDHINRNRLDNRFLNLREATRSQNLGNQTNRRAGLKGAYPVASTGKWNAKLGNIYLGTYPTEQQAHDAHMEAARAKYGEFARS